MLSTDLEQLENPRVHSLHFKLPTVEEERQNFELFLSEDRLGSYDAEFIFQTHPELELALRRHPDQPLQEVLHNYLTTFYSVNKTELEHRLKENQLDWDKYGTPLIKELQQIIGVDEIPTMVAYLSVMPICPRFLQDNCFNVFYASEGEDRKKLIAEEVLHMIYFQKWREVFPNFTWDEFEFPSEVWALSEMMVPVILNDPKIVAIIGSETELADYYNEQYPQWKDKIAKLQALYKESREDGKAFEEFLRESFAKL